MDMVIKVRLLFRVTFNKAIFIVFNTVIPPVQFLLLSYMVSIQNLKNSDFPDTNVNPTRSIFPLNEKQVEVYRSILWRKNVTY